MDENPGYTAERNLAVHYTLELIGRLIRFYDTVAGGFHPFYHYELETVDHHLKAEINHWIGILKENHGIQVEFDDPFATFDVTRIRSEWITVQKGRVLRLKYMLEKRKGYAPKFELQYEQLVFLQDLDVKLRDYETMKWRNDAEQNYQALQSALGRDQRLLSQMQEAFPQRSFEFIEDQRARDLIVGFYMELRSVYFSDAVASPIILTGAIIEALLKESLKSCSVEAESSWKKINTDKSKQPIDEWTLADAITVAIDVGLLPDDLETQMAAVRNFRNFVHIQRLVKSKIRLDGSYKGICKLVLDIVIGSIESWFAQRPLT